MPAELAVSIYGTQTELVVSIDGTPVLIQLGDSTQLAASFSNAASASATAAAVSATAAENAVAAAVALGEYHATLAAGIAATAVGEWFTSDEDGSLSYYKHIAGAPFYELKGAVNTAPPYGLFSTLDARIVPPSTNVIQTTGYDTIGTGAATYVDDALSDSALATAHPLFCVEDAGGRYWRLLSWEIDFAQGGFTGAAGVGDRQAIQATIDYAVAVGIPRVFNGAGAIEFELWDKVATGVISPLSTFYAEKLLSIPACDSLEIDFGGAIIILKSPTGTARYPGQVVTDVSFGTRYMGGFIAVAGVFSERLRIVNVKVYGGFGGSVTANTNANLYDKGIGVQDFVCGTLITENVELYDFGGEIFYDNSSAVHLTTNCVFDGSGQSAWNPSGLGKVFAVNLRAGRAYHSAEVLGGAGHTYIGGEFYDGGSAGASFLGGPFPAFLAGRPYSYSVRDDTKEPPWITFIGTKFGAHAGYILLGSWIRGSIKTRDLTINPGYMVGRLRDIDLDVEAWIDLNNNIPAVFINGPPTLTTQVSGATAGIYYEKPCHISIRVTAHRTALAKDAGRKWQPVVSLGDGLMDKDTIRIEIKGENSNGVAWSIAGSPVAGYGVPLMLTELDGFANGAPLDFVTSADLTLDYLPTGSGVGIMPQTTATTWVVTLVLTYGYAHGQPFDIWYSTTDATRITTIAKNATGVMLNADRTLRRKGEFLRLEYDIEAAKFREVGFLDQGA